MPRNGSTLAAAVVVRRYVGSLSCGVYDISLVNTVFRFDVISSRSASHALEAFRSRLKVHDVGGDPNRTVAAGSTLI